MVTNVNAAGAKVSPLGGAGTDGTRVIYISALKGAQNDTVTLSNINELLTVHGNVDDGSLALTTETFTATTAGVITLTGAATGTVHIVAIVK